MLPLDKDSLYAKGNMEDIFPTKPMNPQEPPVIEVKTYLDSLVVHFCKRIDYPYHFLILFERGKQLL